MTGPASDPQPPPSGETNVFWHSPWALFLDIDGTLLELVDDPGSVRADAALLNLLDRLAVRFNGAMALVSGRDLQDIDRIMAPRRYRAAGNHGLAIRSSGDENPAETHDSSALNTVADDLDQRIGDASSPWIERKSRSLTFHFRGQPDTHQRTLDLAQTALARLGDGYRILPGKDVFEVVPVAADKGAAIAHFLALPPFLGRRPIFVGDDVTDEPGFAVVNRVNGLSIRIGEPAVSVARHALSAPATLRAWLADTLLAAPASPPDKEIEQA